MDQKDTSVLTERLGKTIEEIDKKRKISGESVLDNYLKRYREALDALRNGSPDAEKKLRKLKNCARGYLETSSDYDQVFLHEMGETEKAVKKIVS